MYVVKKTEWEMAWEANGKLRYLIQSVSIRLVHMIVPVDENRAFLLIETTDGYIFAEVKQKLLKQNAYTL